MIVIRSWRNASGWRWLLMAGLLPFAGRASTLAEESFKLNRPSPFEVIQREGFNAELAHEHADVGPALGSGRIPVEGIWGSANRPDFEYRGVLKNAPNEKEAWSKLSVKWKDSKFQGDATLSAGGWYRLEVRARNGDSTAATQAVEPVGVGEVFIIAGQSYAAGANDKLMRILDPAERVAALDVKTGRWRVANDPQPNVGEGGTIWPCMANALLPAVRVPIGLVNVAVGGTSSRQWLPGSPLFEQLAKAGIEVGLFRAVLWQQGESDVIERVSTEKYVENMTLIRNSLAKTWGAEPPWLLAKSTLHPTVYRRPTEEQQIREAIHRLQRVPGFRPGPDTDVLGGSNRGGPNTRRHFSAEGQENAGLLWFASVWNELQRDDPRLSRSVSFQIQKTRSGNRFGILGEKPKSPAPTLIFLGLGVEQMRTNHALTEAAEILVGRGWIGVTIDPPCHGADVRPGEPDGLRGWRHRLERGEDVVADFNQRARAVLDHLIQEKWCDAQRIAVCGVSRGGFLALHLARADKRFRAAVGFAPVIDLRSLTEFAKLGDNKQVDALALDGLAADFADRAVWLAIGNNDDRVDTDKTVRFARLAAAAAARRPNKEPIPIELFVGSSLGHRTPANAHPQAADWIERQLSSPLKPATSK